MNIPKRIKAGVSCTRWPFSGLAALGVSLSVVASGATAQNRAAQGAFNTLTFTLAAPSKQFVLLEPIPFTLRLSNDTTRSVHGHTALSFVARKLRLESTPHGLATQFVNHPSRRQAIAHVIPRLIKPGERHETNDMLIAGLEQILGFEGSYDIRAALTGLAPGETIWSNSVTVRVKEPEGFDKEAFDYIQSTGRGASFLARVMPDAQDHAQQLERFVSLYGDSSYGDYAVFALGAYHADRNDYATARPYLLRAAGKPQLQQWPESARYLKVVNVKR